MAFIVTVTQLKSSRWCCSVCSGGFQSSKTHRCGCQLGAGDLGDTQHTSYGATLLLTPFPGLKVAHEGHSSAPEVATVLCLQICCWLLIANF